MIASLRVSVFPTKLALTELSSGSFIQWKKCSDDTSVIHHQSGQLVVEGESTFNSSRVMEEGDVIKEDEDGEDGIRFTTLESRFENNIGKL